MPLGAGLWGRQEVTSWALQGVPGPPAALPVSPPALLVLLPAFPGLAISHQGPPLHTCSAIGREWWGINASIGPWALETHGMLLG